MSLSLELNDDYLGGSWRADLAYCAIMILVGATILYYAEFNSDVKKGLGSVGYGQAIVLGFFLVVAGAATPFLHLSIDYLKKKKKRHKQEPLAELARLRLIEKHLTSANLRLVANHFEGASDDYHFAARNYLSLENWESSAKYYWMAAEALSKASTALSFGVSLLFAHAAFAYRLCNDLQRFKEATVLAEQACQKLRGRAKERASFILTILRGIQKGETKQLTESWVNNTRKIEEDYGPYAEELITLIKKNLDLTTVD